MDNRTATTLTIMLTRVNDSNIAFQVKLTDDSDTNLAGKPIKFYMDDTLKATKNTNTSGRGSYTFTGGSGEHTLKAEFEGDDTYQPAVVTTTVTVE